MKNRKIGKTEEPEIYAIKKDNVGSLFSRKDFLGTLAAGSVGIAINPLLTGCKKDENSAGNSIRKSIFGIETQYLFAGFRFSPDGKILASFGSGESSINLWSIPKGNLLRTLENVEKYPGIKSVKFSPDGQFFIVDCYVKLNIWLISEGVLLKTIAQEGNENDQITHFEISPDGKNIAYNKYPESSIKIYSIPDGKLLNTLNDCFTYKNNFQFSPDGKYIVSGSGSVIMIYTFPEGNLFKAIVTDIRSVFFKFSPDGKSIATNEYGENGIIKLYFIPEGNLFKTIEASPNWTDFEFSQNGKLLASYGSDKTIKLWSLPEGTLLYNLTKHTDQILSLCFSMDEKIFASCQYDTILLWSLNNGVLGLVKTINEPIDSKYASRGLCFSPDGKILASNYGTSIKLWSVPESNIVSAGSCICDTVCTCNTVAKGNDNTVCTCNTVEGCTCNSVCSCNAVCSCNKVSTGGGGGYWYPN